MNKNVQEWTVNSADGKAFYICNLKPDGGGPYPSILFIHGGMGEDRKYTRAMLDWSLAELLLQKGFALFSTDYRVDHTGKDIGDFTNPNDIIGDRWRFYINIGQAF